MAKYTAVTVVETVYLDIIRTTFIRFVIRAIICKLEKIKSLIQIKKSFLKKSQTRPCPAQSKSLFIIGDVNSAISTSTGVVVVVVATFVVVLALVVVVVSFVVGAVDACVVVTTGGIGNSI